MSILFNKTMLLKIYLSGEILGNTAECPWAFPSVNCPSGSKQMFELFVIYILSLHLFATVFTLVYYFLSFLFLAPTSGLLPGGTMKPGEDAGRVVGVVFALFVLLGLILGVLGFVILR